MMYRFGSMTYRFGSMMIRFGSMMIRFDTITYRFGAMTVYSRPAGRLFLHTHQMPGAEIFCCGWLKNAGTDRNTEFALYNFPA